MPDRIYFIVDKTDKGRRPIGKNGQETTSLEEALSNGFLSRTDATTVCDGLNAAGGDYKVVQFPLVIV